MGTLRAGVHIPEAGLGSRAPPGPCEAGQLGVGLAELRSYSHEAHGVAPVKWDEGAPSLGRAVPAHKGAEPRRGFGSRDGPHVAIFCHQLAGAPRLILCERGEHLLTPGPRGQAGVPNGLAVPRGNVGPCPETLWWALSWDCHWRLVDWGAGTTLLPTDPAGMAPRDGGPGQEPQRWETADNRTESRGRRRVGEPERRKDLGQPVPFSSPLSVAPLAA